MLCDGVIFRDGWIIVDNEQHELRLHDGSTPGGHIIPNVSKVLIETRGGAGAGVIKFDTLDSFLSPSVRLLCAFCAPFKFWI